MKLLIAVFAICVGPLFAQRNLNTLPPVSFRDVTLDNGLRVLIAEVHAAPILALAVTYRVGSRDESPGRTGFAHFFEHLMFKGSDNVGPGEHVYIIWTRGGSMDGTTSVDRTRYFEVLPKNQLNRGLLLEADRMRSLSTCSVRLPN